MRGTRSERLVPSETAEKSPLLRSEAWRSSQAITAGVHAEYSSHDGRLILPNFEAHTGDKRPSVLVDAGWIFDRNVAISEAAASGVQTA